MFGGFFYILIGLYALYYIGMVGYDLYVADKTANPEDTAQVVDVSAAASSYVPKDVRSMIEAEKQDDKNYENFNQENIEGGGRGQYIGQEYQEGYSAVDLKDMFIKESQTPSLFSGIQLSI